MYAVVIKNAQVRDVGWGLEVNGKPLANIISTLLGTRVGDKTYFTDRGLEEFNYNSCDISICITPHKNGAQFKTGEKVFNSMEEMEDFMDEQFNEKSKKTDAEE